MTDDRAMFNAAYKICKTLFKEFHIVDSPISEEDADYINLYSGITIKILPCKRGFVDVDVTLDPRDEEDLYYRIEDTRQAFENGLFV